MSHALDLAYLGCLTRETFALRATIEGKPRKEREFKVVLGYLGNIGNQGTLPFSSFYIPINGSNAVLRAAIEQPNHFED